ncbi:MAG: hypothetical protein EPN36_10180 [Rhodanobacteraceae bacterium]|nr:MAG: hypothetical protein EPN36_10180 [Rhodanobacteraceae bacterium]
MLEHNSSAPTGKRTRKSTMPEIPCRCLALVACDWKRQGASDRTLSDSELKSKRKRNQKIETGFAPHFAKIVRIASDHGADTILFSPWSHTVTKARDELRHADLFPKGTKHQAVILGVRRRNNAKKAKNKYLETIEVHTRSKQRSYPIFQQFSTTRDKKQRKRDKKQCKEEDFMDDLRNRRCGKVTAFICGETNIVSVKRAKSKGGHHVVVDKRNVRALLDANGVRVVLNPVHDYMTWKMKPKRAALSSEKRTVVSVWNRGYKKREAKIPWTVYWGDKTADWRDQDASPEVEELPDVCTWPVSPDEPGVRIGILKLR